MVSTDDGFDYYADVIIYVYDVMFIHHDTDSVLKRIDKHLKLKPSFIGNPDIYLGAKLKNMILENWVW